MRCDASLWAPTNPSKDVLDIADSLYQKDPRAQKWSSWRRTFQLAHFHGTNFCVVSSFRANLRDRFQEVFYRENTTLRVCPKVIASAELKYPELMSRVNVRLLDATALDTSLDFTGTGWSAGAGVKRRPQKEGSWKWRYSAAACFNPRRRDCRELGTHKLTATAKSTNYCCVRSDSISDNPE
jgi:hypothetical protein